MADETLRFVGISRRSAPSRLIAERTAKASGVRQCMVMRASKRGCKIVDGK